MRQLRHYYISTEQENGKSELQVQYIMLPEMAIHAKIPLVHQDQAYPITKYLCSIMSPIPTPDIFLYLTPV